MSEPTQEQKCADLARAMGWTDTGNGLYYSPEHGNATTEDLAWFKSLPPDPFTYAEDSRALCAWLAKQGEIVQEKFEAVLLYENVSDLNEEFPVGLFYLNAPLPVIADAAWQAIQEPK